jgi:ketosteroid isomerase-like protein
MSEQDNVRTVQEAYAAFGRGDIPGLLSMLDENVEWITPGSPDVLPTAGTRRGREGVAEFFSTLAQTDDIEVFEPQEFIAQGDKVVAIIKCRTRLKASGRAVDDELVHIFTVRDGRIARFREYFDTAAAVEALRGGAAQATTGD